MAGKPLLEQPAALLLGTGFFLGLVFPLGRLASEAGVTPLVWAFVVSAGTTLVTALFTLPRNPRVLRLAPRFLRYYAVTAFISYALPNVLIYSVIPHLGSAYAAVMLTLSPLLTLAISALAGLKRPLRLEIIGLVVASAGALLVAAGRGEAGRSADLLWVLLGLAIPVCLALGNVYRTLDWPPEAEPAGLAIGSHAVAALMLAAAALAARSEFLTLGSVPGLSLVQAFAGAAMFSLYFRLQKIGGPVTLSQIGSVSAAVGVLAGTLVFGERYAAQVWFGMLIIAVGLACTVKAKQK